MKRALAATWTLAALFLWTLATGPGAAAATLSYSYGNTVITTSYNYRPLNITASEGGATVWTMAVRVPAAGYSLTGHSYFGAGQIISFKDVLFGGAAFEYSPEPSNSDSPGMMFISNNDSLATFLDGTSISDHSWQTAASYSFSKTYTVQAGITAVTTITIHAPVVSGADYQTTIDATCTYTNTSGATYSLMGSSYAGSLNLSLASGGLADWSIVNPSGSISKPNVHNTDVTDGHELYKITDWYGSTTTNIPGFYAKMEVKENSWTQSRNLRPGMTFELRSDLLDFHYATRSGVTKGATSVNLTKGVSCNLDRLAWVFGDGAALPDGQSVTLAYRGLISTTPVLIAPVAQAGIDQSVDDLDLDGHELRTLDGSGSYAADGVITGYAWQEGSILLAEGVTAQVDFPCGTHTVTLIVTDSNGLTGSDTVTITVNQMTPRTFYVDQNHPNASDANPGTDESAPWLTLGQAAGNTGIKPGDTILVKAGVYRESIDIAQSGFAGLPITYQAKPGDRVVVSGSDQITGWAPLGATSRNPNHASIYSVDLTWKPTHFYENDQELPYARSPNGNAYWVVGAGSDFTHIVDTADFTQDDQNYWRGAWMFFINKKPVQQQRVQVTAYDPGTQTVTVSAELATPALGDTGPQAGVDCFYMYNKLELLDTPGEWVCEDLGDGTWRLYVWPSDGGHANGSVYEGSRRGSLIFNWGAHCDLIIDGFEIRHSTSTGIGSTAGSSNITVRNLLVHHNSYISCSFSNVANLTMRNCLVTRNGYGVSLGSCSNALVEGNEISWNENDGLLVAGAGTTGIHIRNNFIHDHFLWAHPDNSQFHSYVSDVWYENNALINGGQGVMMEAGDGIHFINNIIVGSGAQLLPIGSPIVTNIEWRNNVLGLSGYGIIGLPATGTGYTLKNNILYQGHENTMFSSPTSSGYLSDYNLMFLGPNLSTSHIVSWLGVYYNTFAAYAAASHQDANSLSVDPQFVNAPAYYDSCAGALLPQFTTSRVYLTHAPTGYAVGDHLEYNFDGVVRQITAVDTTNKYVEFSPPLAALPITAGNVLNWKTRTSFAYDFRLAAGSPCRGAGERGADMGSTINLAQYRAGDFDGDGRRDIPAWPSLAAPLSGSAAVDRSWVYQNTPVTTGNRHHAVLTVAVSNSTSYTVSVTQTGGPGQVTIQATADPLTWNILGGMRSDGATGTGAATLSVTVTDATSGASSTVPVALTIRRLGDVDGAGGVSGQDKLQLSKRLNGLLPDGPEYDFDGLGGASGQDKLILNKILNGIVIP